MTYPEMKQEKKFINLVVYNARYGFLFRIFFRKVISYFKNLQVLAINL